jgi:hypothetical protein
VQLNVKFNSNFLVDSGLCSTVRSQLRTKENSPLCSIAQSQNIFLISLRTQTQIRNYFRMIICDQGRLIIGEKTEGRKSYGTVPLRDLLNTLRKEIVETRFQSTIVSSPVPFSTAGQPAAHSEAAVFRGSKEKSSMSSYFKIVL